jgi:ornithine cyclodeaminase/alanine dehydrogenase-like protein (mu-crystallin family)
VDLIQNSSKYAKVKNGLSVFDSTGWALEDQVVMDLFLDLAAEFGIGLEVALENVSDDAKNPYNFLLKTVDAQL